MIFIDFEVTRFDWLVVCIDPSTSEKLVIHNDLDALKSLYRKHRHDIWAGFNIRHYDQYILKALLCGFDAYEMNDWIITHKQEGWAFSKLLRNVPLIIYDVMFSQLYSLKSCECFMGSSIRETDVSFMIDRPLNDEELEQMISYCTHDVEQTIEVFTRKFSDFDAMFQITQLFDLPADAIGYTEARITSTVLGCETQHLRDEFDYYFLPCIQLNKYAFVRDWFDNVRNEYDLTNPNDYIRSEFYKRKFTCIVAGVPHTFGFGGLHGAPDKPVHYKGSIYHVDVNNYYPSMLIAYDLVTRAATNDNYTKVYNTRKQLKQKQLAAQAAGDKALAKSYKKQQTPYKKMLNALSGAMKDRTNKAHDSRNNNIMCINGQLMLLDLIEHLESIPGFVLIQSNTDGLIVQIPDTDEAFEMLDDICYDWECRCSTPKCEIGLATDSIAEIYQKDVNNYLWIEADGSIESKGSWVKELSDLDYDLPIVNKAVVAYITKRIPVRETIESCNELIEFQKLVKLSGSYDWVEHECGGHWVWTSRGWTKNHTHRTEDRYTETERFTNKCYRVFASTDIEHHGRLLKCKDGKRDKPGGTPDHCFIYNGDVRGVQCPDYLDKQYYIDMANDHIKQFGL